MLVTMCEYTALHMPPLGWGHQYPLPTPPRWQACMDFFALHSSWFTNPKSVTLAGFAILFENSLLKC